MNNSGILTWVTTATVTGNQGRNDSPIRDELSHFENLSIPIEELTK